MALLYFCDEEFACKCGKCALGIENMDENLLRILDAVREKLGSPMRINSAVRCAAHNSAVGGSVGSEHVPQNSHTGKSTAVDIHIPDSHFLYKLIPLLYAQGVPRMGLNQAKNFIHVGLSAKHPQEVFFKY